MRGTRAKELRKMAALMRDPESHGYTHVISKRVKLQIPTDETDPNTGKIKMHEVIINKITRFWAPKSFMNFYHILKKMYARKGGSRPYNPPQKIAGIVMV